MRLLALALLALGCARPRPAPDVAAPPRAHPPPATPLPGAATAAPPEAAALPPLFARKARCVDPRTARMFARRERVDGGFASHPLTHHEVLARPWLWGQYPSGCAGVGWRPPGAADAGASDRVLFEGTGPSRALAAADVYLGWGRVDDLQRWAPFDCRLPPGSRPQPDLGADAPHGRKVYYLYALDRAAYVENRDVSRQVVVKEAWAPREVPRDDAVSPGHPPQCAAEHDGLCVQPGDFRGLFLMMRGEATPDTDAGWTYATVDPRGEVTASGRIAQCMGCHEDAPHGRLFGVPSGARVRWR